MKTYGSILKISLCAALRAPRTWILALAVTLIFAAARFCLPETEQAAPVQVGVWDESGGALWDRLQKRSGTVVQFLPADPDTISTKVSTSQWDCGILVPEDFSRRIAQGDTNQILTLITGPGSVAYPLVQETLAAILMELSSPVIGADYLADSGMLPREEAAGAAEALYQVLTDEERVQVTMKTLNGKPLDALQLAQNQTDRVLRGILALILLAAALYLAEDLGKWLESDPGRRMLAIRPPWYLLLPRAAAGMLGPALGTAGALAVLGASAVPAAIVYLLALTALAAALARGKRLFWALPVLMPFLVLGAALLSPILFDVGAVWAPAGWLSRGLPVTLFLRAGEGSLPDLAGLLAEAAVFGGLAWLPAFHTEKKTRSRAPASL